MLYQTLTDAETPAASWAKSFTYAAGKLISYAETRNGTTARYWVVTDQIGSVVKETDASGAIVAEQEYASFGTDPDSGAANGHETLRWYAGKEWDGDIELYYFNARWYDPELGRFITEDPARDDSNWYVYCLNSPETLVDPTGLYILHVEPVSLMNTEGSAWVNTKTGKSVDPDETIGKVGCLVTALANMMTAFGIPMTPSDINANKSYFVGSEINQDKFAEVNGLTHDYWTQAVQGVDGLAAIITRTFASNITTGIIGEVTSPNFDGSHRVNVNYLEMIDNVLYAVCSPTSIHDMEDFNRTGWLIDGENIHVPFPNLIKIDTYILGKKDTKGEDAKTHSLISKAKGLLGALLGLFTSTENGKTQESGNTSGENAPKGETPSDDGDDQKGAPSGESSDGNASGTNGQSSGGSVICTELHRQGFMNDVVYLADEQFGAKLEAMVPFALKGYRFMAMPIVRKMKQSRRFTEVVHVCAEPWIREMAYIMGSSETSDWRGMMIMIIGLPIMTVVGFAMTYPMQVALIIGIIMYYCGRRISRKRKARA